GVEPHIGGTARVGVIAEADELRASRQSEVHQRLDVLAAQLGAKDDDQAFLILQHVSHLGERLAREMRRRNRIGGAVVSAEELYEAAFGAGRDLRKRCSLAMQLDGRGIYQVQLGAMQANIGANLPRQQWMLLGGIISNQQDGGRVVYVAH